MLKAFASLWIQFWCDHKGPWIPVTRGRDFMWFECRHCNKHF